MVDDKTNHLIIVMTSQGNEFSPHYLRTNIHISLLYDVSKADALMK